MRKNTFIHTFHSKFAVYRIANERNFTRKLIHITWCRTKLRVPFLRTKTHRTHAFRTRICPSVHGDPLVSAFASILGTRDARVPAVTFRSSPHGIWEASQPTPSLFFPCPPPFKTLPIGSAASETDHRARTVAMNREGKK